MIVSLKAMPLQEEPGRPGTNTEQQPSVFDLTIGASEIVVQTSVVLTALWRKLGRFKTFMAGKQKSPQ